MIRAILIVAILAVVSGACGNENVLSKEKEINSKLTPASLENSKLNFYCKETTDGNYRIILKGEVTVISDRILTLESENETLKIYVNDNAGSLEKVRIGSEIGLEGQTSESGGLIITNIRYY